MERERAARERETEGKEEGEIRGERERNKARSARIDDSLASYDTTK